MKVFGTARLIRGLTVSLLTFFVLSAPASAAVISGPGGRIATDSIRHRSTLYIPMGAVQRAYTLRYISREGETFLFASDRFRLRITPGSKLIEINGRTVEMSAAADWKEGKLIVPIYLAILTLRKEFPGASRPAGPPTGKTRIVIDPGHGGIDSGAVGDGGLEEKAVVLEIARKTADLLEIRGYDLLLTRNRDRYISLRKRAGIANRYRAGIFVSIHANAAYNDQARGTETFVYSPIAGIWGEKIARLENAVLRLETEGPPRSFDLPGKNTEGERLGKSRRLAGRIQKRISGLANGPDRGVKAADLYVLKYTRMPAVLVETGFLSNRQDCGRLADIEFRETMAEEIAAGIADYIEEAEKEEAGVF